MNNIKKIFLAAALLLSGIGVAQAGPFTFGVKAGLNVNKLKFNDGLTAPSNSCGWTAGVTADYSVPIIGIGGDVAVMYSRMNNGNDAADLYGKNFIEIPVNVKYKFTIPVVASVFKPYLFTGPQFGVRLDKKYITQALESRAFQFNWNVGIGIELINHLQVGASYAFGCNNIVKNIAQGVTGATLDTNVKNNYWTVTAAWLF